MLNKGQIELSDIHPKDDKTLIELYKNKANIRPNKIGTLNYLIDEERMYITKKPKGNRNDKVGIFDEVLTRNNSGVLKDDLIIGGNLTVNDFTVHGDCTNKIFKKITIDRPIIEINANESDKGISLKRSGLNINRGLKGSANIFYDENINSFHFCLDENKQNESFSHTTIKQRNGRLIPTSNKQVFKSPIPLSKYESNLIFINSIKILADNEYKIDYEKQEIVILDKLTEETQLNILNFKVRQFDTIGEEITDSNSYLDKYTYNTEIVNDNRDITINLKKPNMEEDEIKSIDNTIILAFLNGVFLNPDFYTIKDNGGLRGVFSFSRDIDGEILNIENGSQLYLVALSPEYGVRDNRIIMATDNNKTATPEVRSFIIDKELNEYIMPINIEKENTAIIFVNSVLLDTNNYRIEGDKLILLNIKLKIGSVVEIVKIDAFTTSPDIDTLSYLLNKEDFKTLMELSEDEVLTVKMADLEKLKVNNGADITGLKVYQRLKDEYALDVDGHTNIKGNLEVNRLSKFKDNVTFNELVTNKKKVVHEDYVIHKKPYLYINDALDQDDGGLKLERVMAPHAVITWKEEVKRWFAGIEGTEKPIVTMDMLELIMERFMDLAGIDNDVYTYIDIDQSEEIIVNRDLKPNESWFFTYDKRIDSLLLVFMNGRYISEDEYTYNGNQVFFNGSINKNTKITFINVTLRQHSLTGYPIKEEVTLKKNIITLKADEPSQRKFELPYSISEYDNANILFLNGILLSRELYQINGNLLTLLFDCMLPTEINILSVHAIKGGSASKVQLVNRHIKVEAENKSQKDFILPTTLKEEKNNFLVFCNTSFIPKDYYEINDRVLTLKDIEKNFVNPPTEISIVEIMTVLKNSCSCNSDNINRTNSRSYSVKVKAYQRYVKIPFMLNMENQSIMIYLDGRILSKRQYHIIDNLIELKELPQTDTELVIMDFSKDESGLPSRLSNKGTRVYEETIKSNTINLPFNIISSEDTNLIFIDGVLCNEKYSINNNVIVFENNNVIGKEFKIINFSDVRNHTYTDKMQKDQKVIIKHDKDIRWNIRHNLNTYPNVVVIDGNNQVIKDVRITYDTTNSIVLEFNEATSGKVVLS